MVSVAFPAPRQTPTRLSSHWLPAHPASPNASQVKPESDEDRPDAPAQSATVDVEALSSKRLLRRGAKAEWPYEGGVKVSARSSLDGTILL